MELGLGRSRSSRGSCVDRNETSRPTMRCLPKKYSYNVAFLKHVHLFYNVLLLKAVIGLRGKLPQLCPLDMLK